MQEKNQVSALLNRVRISPRKLNIVANLIRGKKVSKALDALAFCPKRIARDVRKTLISAIANAENNYEIDVDRLKVIEASVGKSVQMRRYRPRAKGRSSPIRKPFSRLRVVVQEVEV